MIHAQFAIATLVFAMAMYLAFAERPTVLRGVLMTMSLALSLLLYEVGYIAVVLAPALLLVPRRISLRRFSFATTVWLCVPFLNGIRVLLLFSSDQQLYERDLVMTRARAPFTEFVDLVQFVFQRGLGGFVDPPSGVSITGVSVVLLLACVSVVLHSAVRTSENLPAEAGEGHGPNWPNEDIDVMEANAADEPVDGHVNTSSTESRAPTTDRRRLMMTIGALASAPIVALIYSPHSAHLVDPLRIFSIACLPLAIAIVGALEILARYRSVIAVTASVVLLVLAASSATASATPGTAFRPTEEAVLGAISIARDSAPELATQIVVIDPEHLVGDDVYTFIPEILQLAVLYLLPDVNAVLLCHAPFEELSEVAATPTDCVLENGAVRNNLGSVLVVSAAVIEIRHTEPGSAWSGVRQRPSGPRIRSVLVCVGAGTCDAGPFGVQARVIPT